MMAIFEKFLPVAFTTILLFAVSTSIAFSSPDQWKRAGFTTDFSKSKVDLSSIFSGGPPKDGIPSIDNPQFEVAETAKWLDDAEPVILLTINETTKAYPLQILIWHEIVNDTVASTPVSVTYCPLCNSSIVFDRRVDNKSLSFGTTGLLRNSDLVMYDRQTETWWQQFTGEAIVGQHAGRELKMIPSRVIAFGDFKKAHPGAKLLSRPVPAIRDYGRNPYEGYDSRTAPYPFFQGDLPEGINPMERVVLVRDKDQLFAVTLRHVHLQKSVNLARGIVLRSTGDVASILDNSIASKGRSIGAVEAVKSDNNREELLVHDVTFAFVVHAFHPEIPILGINQP